MVGWVVPGLFAAMALGAGARSIGPLESALAAPSLRTALIALYFLLRVSVATAFAVFTTRRDQPHSRAREPLALLACAAAMVLVLPLGGPAGGTGTATVLIGDLLAVGACAWLLASVLALGRCFGVLPEARGLVTRGPYRFVRHPIYLGEILALTGITVSSGSAWSILTLSLFVCAQAVRIRLEERALGAAFPEYQHYASRTGMLLPRLGMWGGSPLLRRLIGPLSAVICLLALLGAAQAAINRSGAHTAARRATASAHGLAAPGLLAPANGAHVEQVPALSWSAVRGAVEYQYQVSADARFRSLIVVSANAGKGTPATHNLATTLEKPVTDGTYYWRVRGVSARDRPGRWSATWTIVKRWTEAPRLLGPAEGAAITWPTTPLVLRWSEVPRAYEYLVTIATDPELSHVVLGSATSPLKTQGSVYAFPSTLPDGRYYWAMTPVDAEGHRGRRSSVGSFSWSWPTHTATWITPLNDPPGASELEWTPEFSWNPVPGAARYQVEVSSAEGFPAGSIWSNTTTIGTSYSPTVALNNNEYYWRVRAIDASGNAGVWNEGPRFIKTFDHQAPTISHLEMVDTNENPTPAYPTTETPIVNWSPVFGAGSYEVQVGRIEGDKYLITQPALRTITGDTIMVTEPENERPPFTITANLKEGARLIEVTKGAQNLIPGRTGQKLSDKEKGLASGTALAGLVDYSCGPLDTFETASTAWTPLEHGGHIGQANWPSSQSQAIGLTKGFSYCVSVAAISDKDAFGHVIESALTPVGHLYEAAFTYDTRFDRCQRAHNFERQAAELEAKGNGAEATEERQDAEGIYNAYETLTPASCTGILEYPEPASTTPSTAYHLPRPGSATSRTPLFTWEPVLGATEYYVVIARNPQFTNVVDVAETYGNAYAPPIGNEEPLDDETTQYYWAVIPAKGGSHVGLTEANNPQSFNKSSIPSVLLAPSEGAVVVTQPTFKWTPVSRETSDGAVSYTLQVSQDPTFAKPIDEVRTDSTAYTSFSTYPADSALYWRVRANDANRNANRKGLNWSQVQTFTRTLPVPAPAADNLTSSEAIPVRSWTPVAGAVGYDVHVELPDGTHKDFTTRSPDITATQWDGPGIFRWQARAEFPTSGVATVPGAYFAPQPLAHTVAPPAGAIGAKAGSRIVISWNPQAYAKQYEVAISTSETFKSTIQSRKVAQTSWAPDVDLSKRANRGTLYWRVAAVDGLGNVGPYATGRFSPPRRGCVTKSVKRKGKTVRKCVVARRQSKKKHG